MAETQLQDFGSIFCLEGKVVVITGGSRGLGLHAASGCLQAGASLVIISSRSSSACTSACAALNALPNLRPSARAIPCPADLSQASGIASLKSQILAITPHVDILLANAGATWGEAFETHPDAAFAKVFDLNVKSVFLTVQALAPLLEQRSTLEDPARVLVTASIAGLIPGTLGKHATYGYAASKAAVIHLVKNLALDLGRQRRHVLVNAIAPGFFPSRMSNGLLELGGGAERMARAVPGGRLGRGEDFAAAVVWLGSRAGSHVDGAVIVLDGGASLGGGMGGGVEEEEGGAAQGAFRAKL